MDLSIETADACDHLLVTLTGNLFIDDTDALSTALSDLCARSGAPTLIADVRNLRVTTPAVTMYSMAEARLRDCQHHTKPVALVAAQDNTFANDYALMASNRGSKVIVFDSMDKARDWARCTATPECCAA